MFKQQHTLVCLCVNNPPNSNIFPSERIMFSVLPLHCHLVIPYFEGLIMFNLREYDVHQIGLWSCIWKIALSGGGTHSESGWHYSLFLNLMLYKSTKSLLNALTYVFISLCSAL